MTSKERAYLMHLASSEPAILFIGKQGVTPELTANIDEALEARELIKIGIQQNAPADTETLAMIAERTKSQIVQKIGRKVVLYRPNMRKKDRITLP